MQNERKSPAKISIQSLRAFFHILVGLLITGVALVGLFSRQLGIETSLSQNLIYIYCAVALLYGPFRIWRGVQLWKDARS